MPFFLVILVTPVAVAVALYRRNPRRFLDGPSEDAPLRLPVSQGWKSGPARAGPDFHP
jgi:hypothetical protein